MCSIGDCYVVLPPACDDGKIILARNALDAKAVDVSQEVHYFDASSAIQRDDGVVPDLPGETLRLILQNPRPGVWGGDYGANERNVCIAITWTADEPSDDVGSDVLKATDIVRYALATSTDANSAVDCIGALIEAHGAEDAKCNFIVCDTGAAWVVSCGSKLWAAERLTEGAYRLPNDGLSVQATIDKSSAELGDALKTIGRWQGEGDLSFATCFDASPTERDWSVEGICTLEIMFDTLRSAADEDAGSVRSATISILHSDGISCHWFTATPNATESVFKPFVFSPKPRISPLTKVPADSTITLLHKLHGQRKVRAIDDLKALEAACVREVVDYLAEHQTVDEELDELLKDCVEAEVKFYR